MKYFHCHLYKVFQESRIFFGTGPYKLTNGVCGDFSVAALLLVAIKWFPSWIFSATGIKLLSAEFKIYFLFSSIFYENFAFG